MTKKEKLIEIAQADVLTDAQKQYVQSLADNAGIPFHPYKTSCRDCYKDMAVILWRKECEKEALKDKDRKFVLRVGVDVLWRGQRVNMTLTDEQLAALVAKGFPKEFFFRYEDNE